MSDAVADLEDVVRFVLDEEGATQVDFLGYSWGTARSVNYALRHASLVRKLVLYAPVWKPCTGAAGDAHNPAAPGQMNPKHGGYALFKPGDLARNWDWEIDKENASRFRSPEALAAAEQALMASDDFTAWGGFRAPLGPMVDALAVTQGSALFDAEQIGCDTLMLRGAQDRLSSELDATSLLNAIGAHNKRLVTFETGTHLLHLEHARDQLINEVSAFLFEP
jgi:pimeloyl-ACP methyl ester carboxylesterase